MQIGLRDTYSKAGTIQPTRSPDFLLIKYVSKVLCPAVSFLIEFDPFGEVEITLN